MGTQVQEEKRGQWGTVRHGGKVEVETHTQGTKNGKVEGEMKMQTGGKMKIQKDTERR